MSHKYHHLRQDYTRMTLGDDAIQENPIAQFALWFTHALEEKVDEANAMTLCTVDAKTLQPSARIVLLKEFDERGFVFFTNYDSRKGKEINAQPRVVLSFFWSPLQRQVIIEGTAEKIAREESVAYFQSRPRSSQIGAWASLQSQVIENKKTLDEKMKFYQAKFDRHEKIPCPEHWGGFRVSPTRVEFWQGGASRLHDRISYEKTDDNTWSLSRLCP